MAFQHGVDDLVLLETISNDSILATLRSRYNANLIYTYIGQVLIAMNPYQMLPIYGKDDIKNYSGRYIFEEPPHVFSIAEHAYHSLLTEGVNQTIIISGESGSGKTETSKFIMKYIAAVTGKSGNVEHVKEQILQSNPVLEAFGNAKTVQNDNSSRFGKYFEIQFNYSGDPTGGRITNYLLEKSRVVFRARNERTFHIFYQLLEGANNSEKQEFGLGRMEDYRYLSQSGCYRVDNVDDRRDFAITKNAMDVIGIAKEEQSFLFRMLAAILHLGNIDFVQRDAHAVVQNKDTLAWAAHLLGQDADHLERALTYRTVSAGSGAPASRDVHSVPLDVEKAQYTRDALAKAVYSAMFDWIVTRINQVMCDDTSEFNIGVLDIYGFEIFAVNSFEQLCINYVNEKLQQIFIDLTLKTEQEEYTAEGIQWENVDYFDNKPCVELIEGRGGILSFLDEECLFPQGTDDSFLAKVQRQCANHPYFHAPDRSKGHTNTFAMEHYAGRVEYTTDTFLDKNKDTLFNDLKYMLQTSRDPILQHLFPPEPVENKKRPPTAGTQFKNQVTALVATLRSCTPHYIRCIRPNTQKRPSLIEEDLTRNQIRYLGLLENVRVRRAGYAWRTTYEKFLHRFRILSSKTFPKWDGSPRDGTQTILNACNVKQHGGGASAYEFGRTKIFIRNPQTLFLLENLRLQKLNDIMKIIQRKWRECRGRAFARRVRQAVPELFWGQKERRRDSIFRQYKGDYIKAKNSRFHKSIKKKHNEKRVVFADKVTSLEKGKSKPRVMIATEKAIYIIGGSFRKKILRRVLFTDIESVELSPLADGIMVFHLRDDAALVVESAKKTEVVGAIYEVSAESERERLNDVDAKGLNVRFCGESLTYSDKKKGKGTRVIQFSRDESVGSKVVIKQQGDKNIVCVATGLDKTAGPQRRVKPQRPDRDRLRSINRAGGRSLKAIGQVKAQHDYTARSARELSFRAGDVINVMQKSSSGMWQGELFGKTGTFPASYVLEI